MKWQINQMGRARMLGWGLVAMGVLFVAMGPTWTNMKCSSYGLGVWRHEQCNLSGCYTQLAVCNYQMQESFDAHQYPYNACTPWAGATCIELDSTILCQDKDYYEFPKCIGTPCRGGQVRMHDCR